MSKFLFSVFVALALAAITSQTDRAAGAEEQPLPKIAQSGAPVTFELWQWGPDAASQKKLMDLKDGMQIARKDLPSKDAMLPRFRVLAPHDEISYTTYWSESPEKHGWGPEKVKLAGSAQWLYRAIEEPAENLERGGKYQVEIIAKKRGVEVAHRSVTFQVMVPKRYFTVDDIVTSCDAPSGYARLLFPGGLKKAVTMSFDDGTKHDRRLVEIFNKYGIRGTFNLISSPLDKDGYITRKEIKALYAGHEVASHTVHHPPLPKLTDPAITKEVMENRKDLERLVGYPVRGLAYPGGEGDDRVAEFLPKVGIVYARLVNGNESLVIPSKKQCLWLCTCHHGDCLRQADKLLETKKYPSLLSVWGHSYEFEEGKNWSLIEDFGKKVGNRDDIWYATNIEVFDYMEAVRHLIVASDGSFIKNPSAIPIWIEAHGRTIELKPGAVTRIGPSDNSPVMD
jgi:peptidoglycan-N-acetylglucosamine deacetylase